MNKKLCKNMESFRIFERMNNTEAEIIGYFDFKTSLDLTNQF